MDNHNPYYDDRYFDSQDGLGESRWVFIRGNRLESRNIERSFSIGETGFGTGLNFLAALEGLSRRENLPSDIRYYTVEKYPLHPDLIESLLDPWRRELGQIYRDFLTQYARFFSSIKKGWNRESFDFRHFSIDFQLFYGDVLDAFDPWPGNVDAWFLDGHDPEKNPEMWSPSVFQRLREYSHIDTTLATYTARGKVKQGLRNQGFFIKREKGFGLKRHMIFGIFVEKNADFD